MQPPYAVSQACPYCSILITVTHSQKTLCGGSVAGVTTTCPKMCKSCHTKISVVTNSYGDWKIVLKEDPT